MKTCKTCKHWEKDSSIPEDPFRGDCSSKKFVYAESTPEDGLQYEDAEGYAATFSTGPNFGCIHHEN